MYSKTSPYDEILVKKKNVNCPGPGSSEIDRSNVEPQNLNFRRLISSKKKKYSLWREIQLFKDEYYNSYATQSELNH